MNLPRLIRRKFNVRVQRTLSPIPSRKGTRLMLADLWHEAGYRSGVEVGVFRGEFSQEVLDRIPEGHLTCVDPWTTYRGSTLTEANQQRNMSLAYQRLAPYVEQKRVTILRMTSLEAVRLFGEGALDFAFIDGDHCFDACIQDLIHWSRVVRQGGMMAVHDYIPMRRAGVIPAVNAYTHAHQIHPWYVTREDLATAFWVNP